MIKLKKGASKTTKPASDFKRPYGYDKFGNFWNLEQAINSDNREWFVDPKSKMPMILVNQFNENSKKQIHWRIKPNVEFTYNGVNYNTKNFYDESQEHLDAKKKIINNGYFFWNGYKIYINNPSEEFIFYNGRNFKADVKGSMLDGTPILIEVVKTSEVSGDKKTFLDKNELITFVIYINDEGNQINEKFNIIGDDEIRKLRERIQEREGNISDIRNRIKEVQRKRKKGTRKDFTEIIERETRKDKELLRIRRKNVSTHIESSKNKSRILQENYEKLEKEYDELERKLIPRVVETKKEIKQVIENRNKSKKTRGDYLIEIKKMQEKIRQQNFELRKFERLRREITNMEKTFKQNAKDCKTEWFRPAWMGSKTTNKLNDLKYWTS